MSSILQYLPPLSTAMPAFTALFGLTGLGCGLYTFTSPAAAPLFRIIPLSSVMPKDAATVRSSQALQSWATLRAYIRVHGVRNFSNGLALVGWSLYALLGTDSPAAAGLVTKCLGIMMMAGAPVAMGDGWLIGEYLEALKGGSGQEDEKEVKQAVSLGNERVWSICGPVFLLRLLVWDVWSAE